MKAETCSKSRKLLNGHAGYRDRISYKGIKDQRGQRGHER